MFEFDGGRLGILTVDFITPVSDDPFTWGQIAAANSISDVFAMGGRPVVALNVVCFPADTLGLDVLSRVLEGGFERVRSAGAFLAGGHSVQDSEPKYGLVVYGETEKGRLWRTTGALPGDKLILTKPLGTGIAVTAIKADMTEDESTITEAMHSMTALNMLSLPDGLHAKVHAATDVTGFGLAGHLLDMLGDNLDCRIFAQSLPVIAGVQELADMGLIPEGSYRNRDAYEGFIDGTCERTIMDVIFDPQTSGGLLLAVSPDSAEEILNHARLKGFERAEIVGEFVPGSGRIKI